MEELRFKLAVAVADLYQMCGRHSILFHSPVMSFLSNLCRLIDPTKCEKGHINPAMVVAISKAAGIPLEKFYPEEEKDG